jgi:hypothetical protein
MNDSRSKWRAEPVQRRWTSAMASLPPVRQNRGDATEVRPLCVSGRQGLARVRGRTTRVCVV